MRKLNIALVVLGLIFSSPAMAAVNVAGGPTSLVTSAAVLPASSSPLPVFQFSLSQDAGETLSSVTVLVNSANASSTLSSGHLANVSLYKDNGDGIFNPASDLVAGSQGSVNIGTTTAISASANNTIVNTASTTPSKFFVTMQTGSAWSDTGVPDSLTVTLPTNGITTSSSSPLSAAAVTATITADTTGPNLTSAVAKNTGGTSVKEAGDSIDLNFSEPTNKPVITSTTLPTIFSVNNGHSILDGTGNLGSATWNASGTVLTLVLSGTSSTTLPSAAIGDTITVSNPSLLTDSVANKAMGSAVLSGDFGGGVVTPVPLPGNCSNGLINGRLYAITGYKYVYMAAACRLKLFKGKSLFRARGNKFKNVINLNTFPAAGKIVAPMDTSSGQFGAARPASGPENKRIAKPATKANQKKAEGNSKKNK